MQRTHVVSLAGGKVALGLSFAALEALCEGGFDPLDLAYEAAREASSEAYQPKLKFGSVEVRKILGIGNEHGEKSEALDGLIFEAGLFAARDAAAGYLAAFLLSQSQELKAEDTTGKK